MPFAVGDYFDFEKRLRITEIDVCDHIDDEVACYSIVTTLSLVDVVTGEMSIAKSYSKRDYVGDKRIWQIKKTGISDAKRSEAMSPASPPPAAQVLTPEK